MREEDVAAGALSGVDDLEIVSTFALGDHLVVYPRQRSTGRVGLWLIPRDRSGDVVAPREVLPDAGAHEHPGMARAWAIDSLVHVGLTGDASRDQLLPGRSTRDAASTNLLALVDQKLVETADGLEVETRLEGGTLEVVHRLRWHDGDPALRCTTEIGNRSDSSVTIESLTSASISGLTPFSSDDTAPLTVHRIRSHWGAEARLVSQSLDELHLDRPWIPVWWGVERYGQVGSTPISGFGSVVAVEDRSAGVTWALQLRWGGSWQIELARRDDDLSVSVGLADFESGHWRKLLAPGERFLAPEAILTSVSGDVDDACAALVKSQERDLSDRLESERELAVEFNEYATSWGNPSAGWAQSLAERVAGSGVKYFVLDCGWFTEPGGAWGRSHGDWNVDRTRFPDGLAGYSRSIRELGMVPGVWLEPETCGNESQAYHRTDQLLARDDAPLTVGDRRFRNLQDVDDARALGREVVDILRDGDLGYVKLDYNASIGLGCDGAESLGEGLRRQVEGTGTYLETLRELMPELVVELCASGGHRNEPWLLSRVDVASSSDAFEVVEVPIVAANSQRIMPPRQSLVWCTLRAADEPRDLVYKLASGFLGRMCLSGDVEQLSEEQWSLAKEAIRHYESSASIIAKGTSHRFGPDPGNYRHPKGWQGVARIADDGERALVVVHRFAGGNAEQIDIPVPGRSPWQILATFASPGSAASTSASGVEINGLVPFSATVVLLGATP